MSTPERAEELLTSSIDDYLLALADGIYTAQKQLSEVAIELQPGQPAITYQLPKVEFEFKMSFQLGMDKSEDPSGADDVSAGAKKVLNIQPVDARSDSSSARAEAASLIRGSFVAVPAGGGQPPPLLHTHLEKRSGRRYGIVAEIVSSVGEKLADREIQFNIDRELSNRLNRANDLPDLSRGQVILSRGVVRTDADGRALSSLSVKDDGIPLRYVAVLVDALGETETLTFEI